MILSLDAVIGIMDQRLPTVEELAATCDCLNIKLVVNDAGQPVLRGDSENRAEREALAVLLKREPFRTQVIEMRNLKVPECFDCGRMEPLVCGLCRTCLDEGAVKPESKKGK